MKFTKVNNKLDEFFPAKADVRKEGDAVEGVYEGVRMIRDKDGKENPVYVVATEEGKKIGVNSYPVIDTFFGGITEGTSVRVEYTGKATSAKSGRQYNDFAVYVGSEE